MKTNPIIHDRISSKALEFEGCLPKWRLWGETHNSNKIKSTGWKFVYEIINPGYLRHSELNDFSWS